MKNGRRDSVLLILILLSLDSVRQARRRRVMGAAFRDGHARHHAVQFVMRDFLDRVRNESGADAV